MERVAQHLQQVAVTRMSAIDRDLFGRSAFNRYYYAMFLEVKGGLAKLRPQWAGELAHATIPELLRGTVKKTFTQGRKTAIRMDDATVISLCSRALSATESLANLMDEGRATRVAADYHPDLAVDFSVGNNFRLNMVGVQMAQAWPHKARTFLKTISDAWIQVDG